jgi:hypothetical protein
MTSAVATKNPAQLLWVAIVYLSGIEIKSDNNDDLISEIKVTKRPPFYRTFQVIDGTQVKEFDILPGTNIGIHIRDSTGATEVIRKFPLKYWEQISQQPLVASLIEKGVFIPVYPESNSSIDGVPRYSDFSEKDALFLLANHTHERWVDSSLQTETRVVIKTRAETRKETILSNRKKLQEGQ